MPRLRQATQMLRAAATLAELEAPEDPHDLHHVSLSDGSAPPAELPASAQPASSRPWLTSRNSGPARAQSEHLHQPDRARAKERARSLRPHRERAAAFEDDVAKFGVGIFLYFRLIRRLALLFFCLALLSTPIIVMNVLRNPHDDDDGLCATPNAKCFLFTTIGNVASGNSSDLLEKLPGSDAERNLASSLVDAFNTAAFLLFTAWLTRKQGKEVQLADDKAVTASDFTVTVTRIPASVTSAQQVKDFFEREAGGRGVHGAGPQRKPPPRLRVALLEKNRIVRDAPHAPRAVHPARSVVVSRAVALRLLLWRPRQAHLGFRAHRGGGHHHAAVARPARLPGAGRPPYPVAARDGAQHVVHGEAPEALALRYADGGLGRQHGDVVRRERAAQHLLQPLTPLESQSTAVGWDVHLALRGAPDALDERWVGLLLREACHRRRLRDHLKIIYRVGAAVTQLSYFSFRPICTTQIPRCRSAANSHLT